MHRNKSDGEADKQHKITLTLTEAIVFTALFGVGALIGFGAFFVRLQKHATHGGVDWLAALLLFSALSLTERTVKLTFFTVRTRRLVLQERQMQEIQKRAGWQ